MPTLTIKNIPEELYDLLKRQAKISRRSINSEVIVCLEQAVGVHRIAPEDYLVRARQLREKTARYLVDDDDFSAAKRKGRP